MKTTVFDIQTNSLTEVVLSEAEAAIFEAKPVSYQEERARAYPDFREYLDGIVKNDQAQIQAYIDACLAVKAKYPKT